MMRNVAWTTASALFAVLLGYWCDLYQFGDAQVWVAALIGGALAFIAYGAPDERPITERSTLPVRARAMRLARA